MPVHIHFTDILRLDCEGYTEPKHTAKTVETKTKDITGTLSLIGGIHPTGSGTLAIKRSKATTKEKQNDRVCVKKTS
jgi:hypothetical protein